MAKHLIHLGFPSWVIDNMVMYDTIVRLHQQGEEVHVFYCDNIVPVCFSNPCAEKSICKWCHWYRGVMDKQLPKGVKVHTFREFYDVDLGGQMEKISFDYNSVEEIKAIKYKNTQVGYGALSTYVSQTRNINPLIDKEFKVFFDGYLGAGCLLLELFDRALKVIKPDVVSLYNGRFLETRPIYEHSKSLGFSVRCYENIRPLGVKNGVSTVYFQDSLPHNIFQNTTLIEKNWFESNLTDEEKQKVARNFFNSRRGGLVAGDVAYTAKQINGLLPNNWDKSKRNIVIFNNSEDEFVAVGDEYNYGKLLFSTQSIGIPKILELFKNDQRFHFYLRIHPNLKDIKYKYHSDLYKLEKEYKNLTVISPESKISSYALLDSAEKVVVFGSTVGVEASYWGKPSILLIEAFYDSWDLSYIPKDIEELKQLIETDLKPKDNLPAIKYGFFVMQDNRGKPIENFDTKATIIRKKYFFLRYRPIRYSTVYLLAIKIFIALRNFIFPNRHMQLPRKEA